MELGSRDLTICREHSAQAIEAVQGQGKVASNLDFNPFGAAVELFLRGGRNAVPLPGHASAGQCQPQHLGRSGHRDGGADGSPSRRPAARRDRTLGWRRHATPVQGWAGQKHEECGAQQDLGSRCQAGGDHGECQHHAGLRDRHNHENLGEESDGITSLRHGCACVAVPSEAGRVRRRHGHSLDLRRTEPSDQCDSERCDRRSDLAGKGQTSLSAKPPQTPPMRRDGLCVMASLALIPAIRTSLAGRPHSSSSPTAWC